MLALTGQDVIDHIKTLSIVEPDVKVVKKDMLLFARTFGTEKQVMQLSKYFTQILMYIAEGE